MSRIFSCYRSIRLKRLTWLNIYQTKLRCNHHVSIEAVRRTYVAVVIVRVIVLLDRHIKGRCQLLQPLNACYLAFCSKRLQRHECHQHYPDQQHAQNSFLHRFLPILCFLCHLCCIISVICHNIILLFTSQALFVHFTQNVKTGSLQNTENRFELCFSKYRRLRRRCSA